MERNVGCIMKFLFNKRSATESETNNVIWLLLVFWQALDSRHHLAGRLKLRATTYLLWLVHFDARAQVLHNWIMFGKSPILNYITYRKFCFVLWYFEDHYMLCYTQETRKRGLFTAVRIRIVLSK